MSSEQTATRQRVLVTGSAGAIGNAVCVALQARGHIVRGVVEGVASIESLTPEGDAIIARFRTPGELLRYMVVKGPVAIDGASLTIIDKTGETFAVSLVQFTQAHTTLMRKRPGDSVNIETDIIARYVETLLQSERPKG